VLCGAVANGGGESGVGDDCSVGRNFRFGGTVGPVRLTVGGPVRLTVGGPVQSAVAEPIQSAVAEPTQSAVAERRTAGSTLGRRVSQLSKPQS